MKQLNGLRFSAPWWAWLAYLAVLTLLLNLGAWQLRRAEAKQEMLTAQAEAEEAEPQDFRAWAESGESEEALYNRPLRLEGSYVGGQSLLQDSQVYEGRVGYHLWTPFQTATGLVLVNRGWLPSGNDRSHLPAFSTPLEHQRLQGLWRPLPKPGLYVGEDDCDRSLWPRVVQYPRLEELECLLDASLANGILLLAPGAPSGYMRDWRSGIMPPAKHYGYALQWFALALALTVIFIWVNTRRHPQ